MAGGGGSEPNLTPFIDLFSVLVCFLLMTTAWLQLESIQVNIEKQDVPVASDNPTPPTEHKDDLKKVSLSVFLYKDKLIAKENDTEIPLLNLGVEFDGDKLKALLKTWRTKFPEKRDIILNTEASVTYGQMIRLYDALIDSDWPDVGINPN